VRSTSGAWRPTISAAHRIAVRIESWRDGKQLAASIPITDGAVTYDDTATLKRRLTISVPARMPDTTVWDPGDSADHPLAAYGQRLHVQIGIQLPTGPVELMDHGWYLITGWQRDETGGTVTVEGQDLAVLLEDARHYREESPPPGSTYAQEFARLAAGILPTRVVALPSTQVNPQTVWERERVKNINDLCNAWGARWHVADDGVLEAAPSYPDVTAATPAVLRLVSGRNGTVVARTRRGQRSNLYNAVVVNGKTAGAASEPAPYGIAEITAADSPIRVQGPYGRRPRFYASELLTTNAACVAAAEKMLVTASSVSRSEPIQASPDPSIQLGDVLEVITAGEPFKGRVTGLTLPMTAAGPMIVTLASTPADNDTEG
jgi:hypothetical protein